MRTHILRSTSMWLLPREDLLYNPILIWVTHLIGGNIIRMCHWNIYHCVLTLFSLTYFDLVIAHVVRKLTLTHYFFRLEICYWLETWHTSDLKAFRKAKNILNTTWYLFLTPSYVSIFCRKLKFYLLFVRLHTLALFFLYFSAFYEFQCLFYKNIFVLTFIMGIFYLTLTWRRENRKTKKQCFPNHLRQICNKKRSTHANYSQIFTKHSS